MMWLQAAVLCMPGVATHLEGSVAAAGGDYAEAAFDVPAGTTEIRISHADGSDTDILDWGVWSPSGFRGWGGGLTEDAVIGVDDASRGYLPGPIAAGTWRVMIGKALLDADGGNYAIDVTCNTTQTLPAQPRAAFAPLVARSERRWYRGDFHVHSRESGDSQATLDQITQLARERGIDFVNLSDHNTVSQHALAAAFLQTRSDVLLLRGAEITTYAGHGNAVGIRDYVDHRIGFAGRTINGVLDDVAAQNAIFLVNHPKLELGNLCIGCAWNHADTDWSKVSGIELITADWALTVGLFVPRVIEMWDQLLDQGHRIAAVGGSDDHAAGRGTGLGASPLGSPTTLVLADNLSEAAIIDAVRRGRTIVQLRGPNDPALDVTMRTRAGNNAEIGDEVDGIDRVQLAISVRGGAGTFAQIWRDGAMLEPVLPVTGDDVMLAFEDEPAPGAHRYRVEIVNDAGQRIVVTSHFYARVIEGDGGCNANPVPSSTAVALVIAILPWLRRRRRAGDRH